MISPEITRTDKGTATALAESPKNPELLYVGLDDGALQRTRNGGREWVNLALFATRAGVKPVWKRRPSRWS
ncbi:MAG: hypothetical protein U1E76_12765 [Planctomycetota bacterium]